MSRAGPIVGSAVSHPVGWAFFLALPYLVSFSQLPRLEVDNSVEIWYRSGDSELAAYRQFQERFGNDDLILVVYESPTRITSQAHLEFLKEIASSLSLIDGVVQTWSLASLPDMDAMVAPDGMSALIAIELDHIARTDSERSEIVLRVRQIADQSFGEARLGYRLAGIGVVYDALNRASFQESLRLFGVSYAVIACLLFVFVGRPATALLCLAAVAYAVTVTMGLFHLAGQRLNMVTAVVPSIVTIYSVSDMVHIVYSFRVAAIDRKGTAELIKETFGAVAVPCLLTSITTIAGFLSLSFTGIRIVRDLGIWCAVGVAVAYLSTQAILAVGLRSRRHLIGSYRPTEAEDQRGSVAVRVARWRNEWPLAFSRRGTRRRRSGAVRRIVVVCSLVAAVGLSAGALRLEVDTFSIELLPKGNLVRSDSEAIERSFGFVVPLEFTVSGETLDLSLLRTVGTLSRRVEDHPFTSHPRSAMDYLPCLGITTTDAAVADCIERSEPLVVNRFIDAASATLRITSRVKMQSGRGFASTIEELIDFPLADGVTVEPAGYVALYVGMLSRIPSAQLRSSLLALAAVLAVILVYAHRPRMAAAATVANIAPLAAAVGVMGVLEIPLDLATVTIAAVSIGIIADDSIHMVHALKSQHRSRGETTRRAVVTTSIVLGTGFLVLALSGVASIARFGFLTALLLAAALYGDLVLLPFLAGTDRAHSRNARASDRTKGTETT